MYFNKNFASDLVSYATMHGHDKQLFKKEMEVVHKKSNYNQVPYGPIVALIKKVVHITQNNNLGLQMGEHFMLQATKDVNEIMQTSYDIEDSFNNAVTFSKLISDTMVCELTKNKQQFSVSFEYNPDWAVQAQVAIRNNLDMALVCALKSLQSFTGYRYYPSNLALPYKKPANCNELYRIFNCRMSFGNEIAIITFSKTLLNKRIQSHNYGLLNSLKNNANQQLKQLPQNSLFSTEVKRQVLKQIQRHEQTSIEQLALTLNMTVRSIQRKLKEEHASFSAIQTYLKMQLAAKYLTENNCNIDEAAYLLGYSEPAAFIRAFKKHFGNTPKQYVKANN